MPRRRLARSGPSHPHPRDGHLRGPEYLHHSPRHQPHPLHPNPNPHSHPHHHHHHHQHPFSRVPRTTTKELLPRHGALQARLKPQHRVHYADTVDTSSYPEEDFSPHAVASSSRQALGHCPPQMPPHSRERAMAVIGGLGDRLRREAMHRSQLAVAAVTNPISRNPGPPAAYLVSKTVRTLRSPTGRGAEIDVEYGTDDNEEPTDHGPGEVVVDQMSSEWWVEGTQPDCSRPPLRQGPKADLQAIAAAAKQQWVCSPSPPQPPPPQ